MAADPSNLYLKRSALISLVAAGDFKTATSIARAMPKNEALDVFVEVVLLVDYAGKGDFGAALARMPADGEQLSPMLWGVLNAWLLIGDGQSDAGLDAFDQMSKTEQLEIFGRYHKGFAHAYLGDLNKAAEILDGDEGGPLHLNRDSIVAHVELLSQLGRQADALQILDDSIDRGFADDQMLSLRDDIADGETFKFSRPNAPAYGMSEAFLAIAEALSRGEPDRTALFYARLAQQLNPQSVDAALLVAELLEMEGQFVLADMAYGTVSGTSALFVDAEIGRAETLRKAGDIEGATDVLVELTKQFPRDVLVLNALGDIYRGVENYKDAIGAYTRAIDSVDEFSSRHWVLFYTRGIGYERLKQWPDAEADFRRALELSPDQPFVLNYLGYSFIEMGINLEEAQKMIETAVAGRPGDGYITDSLGWVLYRLGKFEEAVAPMERAVELLPVDPIVNDHLGDVLWMVGRKLEAEFQWRRAMSFDPEEVDLQRIKRKLEVGLDVVLQEESGI